MGIRVGQSREELVPQLQRSLSEDGGRSVVQRCCPVDVKQANRINNRANRGSGCNSKHEADGFGFSPDAPVFLQVPLHCVGDTEVLSSQRAEEVFVPGSYRREINGLIA